MWLAKRLTIALTLLINQFVVGQSFEWIDTEFKGQACMGVFDVEGELYAVTGNGASIDVHPEYDFQLGFYRLDLDAESTDFTPVKLISIYSEEKFAVNAVEYIKATKEWLIAQSSIISGTKQLYQFILLDNEYNVKSIDTVTISGHPWIFQIHSDSAQAYLLGDLLFPHSIVFLNYNFNLVGDVLPILVGQTSPESSNYITSMKIDPVTKNMLVFYVGGIQIIDTNLNQLVVKRNFEIGTGNHGDVLKIDSIYYSHGLSLVEGGIRRLVFQQYDSTFSILKTLKLGNIDKDNYPFVSKSIDQKDDELLIGAHLDGPANNLNAIETVKRFYLAKFDPELNQIWYKEYGGDNAYWFTGLKILEDKSCLAYGFISDTIEDIRYPYIMRVDEDGNIISSTTHVLDNDRLQIANNGQGSMYILNPDSYHYHLSLFDIGGQRILEQNSSATAEEINLDFIPASSLVYTVVFDDGKMSTGVFIKN